jgi:predicted nucleic-acid-binding protein
MGGDGFYFDRRGNIQKQASIASVAYKQRQTEFNDIIKEIQKKLMGIR